MALALFDLDHTLINGDSDHAWGMYLAEIGAVNQTEQKLKQDAFYAQYMDGSLDIIEYCEFQLQILTQIPLKQLLEWRDQFMQTVIDPMIQSGKPSLLNPHRACGDEIVIITATNDFITRPIADRLGVNHLLATTAEFTQNRYTGKVSGVPCFQQGKLTRLKHWLQKNNKKFENTFFYSDSHNDLPLLNAVDTPIAVTPDQRLRDYALQQQWKIID